MQLDIDRMSHAFYDGQGCPKPTVFGSMCVYMLIGYAPDLGSEVQPALPSLESPVFSGHYLYSFPLSTYLLFLFFEVWSQSEAQWLFLSILNYVSIFSWGHLGTCYAYKACVAPRGTGVWKHAWVCTISTQSVLKTTRSQRDTLPLRGSVLCNVTQASPHRPWELQPHARFWRQTLKQ